MLVKVLAECAYRFNFSFQLSSEGPKAVRTRRTSMIIHYPKHPTPSKIIIITPNLLVTMATGQVNSQLRSELHYSPSIKPPLYPSICHSGVEILAHTASDMHTECVTWHEMTHLPGFNVVLSYLINTLSHPAPTTLQVFVSIPLTCLTPIPPTALPVLPPRLMNAHTSSGIQGDKHSKTDPFRHQSQSVNHLLVVPRSRLEFCAKA